MKLTSSNHRTTYRACQYLLKNENVKVDAEAQMEETFGYPTLMYSVKIFFVMCLELTILFKETGEDWILNTVLKGFRDQIN